MMSETQRSTLITRCFLKRSASSASCGKESVETGPGFAASTRTPSRRPATRSARAQEVSAAFEAP